MPTSGQAVQRNARTELQDWYLASLRPKLARAASTGIVPPASAEALDEQLRDLFEVPSGAGKAA